jgi:hypothetical protein
MGKQRNNKSISVNSPGTYSVTVTDNFGCASVITILGVWWQFYQQL